MKQAIKAIWLKELKDFLRDRKTIAAMILGPLVIILLIPTLLLFMGAPTPDTPISVKIVNSSNAPELTKLLSNNFMVSVIETEINADIIIDFSQKSEKEITADIIYDGRDMRSGLGSTIVQTLILSHRKNIVKKTLIEDFNLTESQVNTTLNPITINSIDTSLIENEDSPFTPLLVLIIPLLIVLWGANIGSGITIDITTGEKERKTMESLLSAPISRTQIVVGKLLAVLTIDSVMIITMVLLSIGGLIASVNFIISKLNIPLEGLVITPISLLLILLLSVVYVAFITAIVLIPCFYARNLKQATFYIAPIHLIVMLLALTSLTTSFNEMHHFAIPIINIIACMGGIFNQSIGLMEIGITFGSSFIYIVGGILIATEIFKKEKVLFRT